MKYKTIFEYEKIYFSEIFNIEDAIYFEQLKSLNAFIEEHFTDQVSIGFNSIKFNNFVGILRFNDLVIEVLPKIYSADSSVLSRNEIYKNMQFMMEYSDEVSLRNLDFMDYGKMDTGAFLDFFVHIFLENLRDNLIRGMYKSYNLVIENLNYLKGRLVIPLNIQHNTSYNKFYCEYDDYSQDNIVNQILKSVCSSMYNVTDSEQNKSLANEILLLFSDVSDVRVTVEDFQLIKWDRTIQQYEVVLYMAKLYIQNLIIDLDDMREENHYNFIFTIDMNKLYETFIYNVIADKREQIFEKTLKVESQQAKVHLIYDMSNKGYMKLIPDIIVRENNQIKYVIDTKYKKLLHNKRRHGVKESDLYQMFGYYQKLNPRKVILLYPKYEHSFTDRYKFTKDTEWDLEIRTVSLQEKIYTKEGFNNLINQLKNIFS